MGNSFNLHVTQSLHLYLLRQRSLLICTCVLSSLQYWWTNWTTYHTCPLWVTLTKQSFKNRMYHLIKSYSQMAYCLLTHKGRTHSTILSFDRLKGCEKLPNQAEVDWGLVDCRRAGERTIRRTISYSTPGQHSTDNRQSDPIRTKQSEWSEQMPSVIWPEPLCWRCPVSFLIVKIL